uniref:Ig-like domain-containing protein n=1 Tax=Anopheles stephensi TaxID=30069 RepID=A0A182Y6U3_ANOST
MQRSKQSLARKNLLIMYQKWDVLVSIGRFGRPANVYLCPDNHSVANRRSLTIFSPLCSFSVLPLMVRHSCAAEQQKFKLTPVDLVVPEGSEALLRCEIHNAAGSVQWTKDGFALGFTQSIPGYPRYSVLGDSGQGIYNLRIVNVTLDDDAEYQCQVGPYMHHTLIRAKAKLTVIGKCEPPRGHTFCIAIPFAPFILRSSLFLTGACATNERIEA